MECSPLLVHVLYQGPVPRLCSDLAAQPRPFRWLFCVAKAQTKAYANPIAIIILKHAQLSIILSASSPLPRRFIPATDCRLFFLHFMFRPLLMLMAKRPFQPLSSACSLVLSLYALEVINISANDTNHTPSIRIKKMLPQLKDLDRQGPSRRRQAFVS